MTADEYVSSVINSYRVQTGAGSAAEQAAKSLYPIIAQWGGQNLLEVRYSGSYAKGTAVRRGTDVDLFISLAHTTPRDLKEIFESLFKYLFDQKLSPRQQNVSIGLNYGNVSMDLVPGKKRPGNTTDHSIYRRKAGTWTQTNVETHNSVVRDSGRLDEIRALKIWKRLHKLDFPSFYLELTVIEALKGHHRGQLAQNVMKALRYIADRLTIARVVDPANSSNIISDDLTNTEKQAIAHQASLSAKQQFWSSIIWVD